MLAAVLTYQQGRLDAVEPARVRGEADRFPLLDLDRTVPALVEETAAAVAGLADTVPPPLVEAGDHLVSLSASELAAVVETWLDDIALVDPRLGFWVQAGAGPVLESGAAAVTPPESWRGVACPSCGGPPQVSVIAEESGEFMAGSPRSLICGRCATWWPYVRATCAVCGQDDPRRLASYFGTDRSWARVDTCADCRGYVKTFDLRERDAAEVVPLVDDVATLALDVWAREGGYSRSVVSPAGV